MTQIKHKVTEDKGIRIGLIIILILFLVIIRLFAGMGFNQEKYCEGNYGSEFIYDPVASGYPIGVVSCYKVSDDGEITAKYFKKSKMTDYCNPADFWQLNKWSSENC